MNSSSEMISAEDVIAKLKDEGDFDKLRLKIIANLKQNEELRNNIVSTVKQSAALNRAGAENLKPRQLSDAIHEEIGNQVMGQISDALWGVIRSSDGMKSEISETVESVYNRLLNPKVNEPSPPRDPTPGEKEPSSNWSLEIVANEREDKLSHNELKETPSFSMCNTEQANNNEGEHKEEGWPPTHDQKCVEGIDELHNHQVVSPSNDDPSVPPGFDAFVNCEQRYVGIDEDPDVPPGFGG